MNFADTRIQKRKTKQKLTIYRLYNYKRFYLFYGNLHVGCFIVELAADVDIGWKANGQQNEHIAQLPQCPVL